MANACGLDDHCDLVAVYLRLVFAGSDDERYHMLMQAYESRRVLLLLDGIDEGGEFKARIEDFVTIYLVQQRVSLIVTSRPEGFTKSKYSTDTFTHLKLQCDTWCICNSCVSLAVQCRTRPACVEHVRRSLCSTRGTRERWRMD